jgi:hypothetical protein
VLGGVEPEPVEAYGREQPSTPVLHLLANIATGVIEVGTRQVVVVALLVRHPVIEPGLDWGVIVELVAEEPVDVP